MFRLRISRVLLLGATCVLAQAQAPKPIGEVLASDASVKGSVVLTGTGASVMSGSSVAAGDAAASLRLTRGGEVRICPGTSISVASSPNGRDLMLGMSTGAIEAEYALSASADSIMTPDFRIVLPGPGNFHFALGADNHGNTCLRTLKSNTASLIVSELLGDATYQVKPNEELLFRGGKINDPVRAAGGCGCAAPVAPVLRAEAPRPAPVQTEPTLMAPPPALKPNDVHIEVDAPMVFRASDPYPGASVESVPMPITLRTLPTFSVNALPPQPRAPVSLAAAPSPPKPKKHFFGKIKSFFASIFH